MVTLIKTLLIVISPISVAVEKLLKNLSYLLSPIKPVMKVAFFEIFFGDISRTKMNNIDTCL